jgi:ferrous iron transport protein A
MFTQSFTVSFSPLPLLKKQETGVISHFRQTDEQLLNQLNSLGITLGQPITLERKFPNFVVKVGLVRLKINQAIAKSIYVRLSHP